MPGQGLELVLAAPADQGVSTTDTRGHVCAHAHHTPHGPADGGGGEGEQNGVTGRDPGDLGATSMLSPGHSR